jgi:hypothetical protein
VTAPEERARREVVLLWFDARQLQAAIAAGEITEVFDDNETS